MKLRSSFLVLCVLTCGFTGLLIFIPTTLPSRVEQNELKHENHTIWGRIESNKLSGPYQKENYTNQSEKRLLRLKTSCKKNPKLRRFSGRKPYFYYSSSARLAICKVPKAGSSFMGALVMAINSPKDSQKMFSKNRGYMHQIKGSNLFDYSKLSSLRGIKVLMTRDPYSRLYSAFIDKFFLISDFGKRARKALGSGLYIKDGYVCGYNITFQQFLDYTTDMGLSGTLRDEHVIPASNLCYPCRVKYDIMARQETLSSDTEYILNRLNLSEANKTAIMSAIKTNGTMNMVSSLIPNHYGHYLGLKKDCPDQILHMEKVWTTLQIQGFISQHACFPRWYFDRKKNIETEEILRLISEVRNVYPQTKEELKRQKFSYLAAAYRDIRLRTIEKIKKMYQSDFYLFGYDLEPPHKRSEGFDLNCKSVIC